MPEVDVFNQRIEVPPKHMGLMNAGTAKRLSVGGIRSGKTWSALIFGLVNYVLAFSCCDILVLRRTFKESETGVVSDFKTLVNKRAYDWNEVKHTATFANGSRVVFGSCTHNREKDIMQYLGQGYPFILPDEVSQFSSDAWEILVSRNTVNAGCQQNEKGELPSPVIWGCTNPIGPFWPYYKGIFIDGKPMNLPERSRRDETGKYWLDDSPRTHCVYDPSEYAWTHSTVLDNAALLKRDPQIVTRLMGLPKAKRDKMLFGVLDRVEGQYFDCFDPNYHVLSLKEDPEAVKWLGWQKVWGGWDWGMAHANSMHLFTRAMVRSSVNDDYKLKTVCFKEVVATGLSRREMAERVVAASILPDGTRVRPTAVYFSHEKFNRVMEQHSPADELSGLLRNLGWPALTPATRDRIASATYMYNEMLCGRFVILDTCRNLVTALPQLQRNPDNLDDVLKVDNVFDDCYDSARLGLFGQQAPAKKPESERLRERMEAEENPFRRRMMQMKHQFSLMGRSKPRAAWSRRVRNPR